VPYSQGCQPLLVFFKTLGINSPRSGFVVHFVDPCIAHNPGNAARRLDATVTNNERVASETRVLEFASYAMVGKLTSIPACRKTLRTEKNNRYFDFKHLKICAYRNISYNFL
jgi:hypothetical protein